MRVNVLNIGMDPELRGHRHGVDMPVDMWIDMCIGMRETCA